MLVYRPAAIASLALIGASSVASAAAPEDNRSQLVAAVVRCVDVADRDERLACFDASAPALAAATKSRAIVVIDREDVHRTRRSLFGFPLPKLALFGNSDDAGNRKDELRVEAVRQIDTTIARANPSGYNLWALILADGSTWRTIEADRSFLPATGGKITIRRAALGNYTASVGVGHLVRVERVR